MRARLLNLMLLRSGRNRLEVPILMTCSNSNQHVCLCNVDRVEHCTTLRTTILLAGFMTRPVVAFGSLLTVGDSDTAQLYTVTPLHTMQV